MPRGAVSEREQRRITYGKCLHKKGGYTAYYEDYPRSKEITCSQCKVSIQVYCDSLIPVKKAVTREQVSVLLRDVLEGRDNDPRTVLG